MDPIVPRGRPEDLIVDKIKIYFKARGWYVKKLHGNVYQSGMPDLYLAHKSYGSRWIEVKTPRGRLEASQVENFHLMAAAGVGVWILTKMDEDDYKRVLMSPANWHTYLT